MTEDPFLDVPSDDPRWGHGTGPGADGITIHYVRRGAGAPVVLLHGWPGFWYDWRRVLLRLEGQADLVAPDFRGFGDSDRPDLPPAEGYTPQAMAMDTVALLDHLGIERAVLVAHDIGATVAQALAWTVPERIRALVLLNPPYLGIGERRFDPSAQREFWYQHLHNLPWSHDLIGYDRDTVRIYLAHFYDHWCGRKEAVRPAEFEAIVDAYARPGAVEKSINYYRARMEQWVKEAMAQADALRIELPTFVLWGELDPVIPAAWSDRIPEFFPTSTLRLLPGVGHFVPFEAPDDVAAEVRRALAETE